MIILELNFKQEAMQQTPLLRLNIVKIQNVTDHLRKLVWRCFATCSCCWLENLIILIAAKRKLSKINLSYIIISLFQLYHLQKMYLCRYIEALNRRQL